MPRGYEHTLNTTLEYGFNWDVNDWLGEAQLIDSTWSAEPSEGVALQDAEFDATSTSVFATIDTPGTYLLHNDITANDGTTGRDTIYLYVPDSVAPATSYLSVPEAQLRLWARYRIEAEITLGDLIAASNEIDADGGPWIGSRKASGQALAFPRSVNPDGTTNDGSVAPDEILDAVALLAHHESSDEGPAITSESVLDRSLTYATPKMPQAFARVANLIKPYQLKVGQRVGVRAYEPSED